MATASSRAAGKTRPARPAWQDWPGKTRLARPAWQDWPGKTRLARPFWQDLPAKTCPGRICLAKVSRITLAAKVDF